MLVDGQGNFGSVDGDMAAAMRYTEVRMAALPMICWPIWTRKQWMGAELRRHGADPGVLPTQVPNLLVNGSSGIAVGMATNIPPHNLTRSVNACLALIDGPTSPSMS
jgi:DNA gyrase subunit A